MIRVPLHLLADSANVSQEGKLNLLGIFENIHAVTFPATHPMLALVFSVEGDTGDAGREHSLVIDLIDSDGKQIANINGKVKFGTPKGGKVSHNQIVVFGNLKFPKPGMYEFKIIINGEERAFVPLHLLELEKPKM
jgi:hypothetical protein